MIRDMRIGYARVSTEDQTLDLQKKHLNEPNAGMFMTATGTNVQRPQLEGCLRL